MNYDEDQLPTLSIETPPKQAGTPEREQIWEFQQLPQSIPELLHRATKVDGLDELVPLKPTLKLDLESIEIIEILGVSYKQEGQQLRTEKFQRTRQSGPEEF